MEKNAEQEEEQEQEQDFKDVEARADWSEIICRLRSSVNIFMSLSCLNSRENWTMWGPKQKWDTRDLIKKRDFQNLHYVNCRSTF